MNKYVTTKRIYIGTLVLVLISFLFPPFNAVHPATGRKFDSGWSLITNLEYYEQVNVTLLLTQLVVIGITAFILIKIIGEQ